MSGKLETHQERKEFVHWLAELEFSIFGIPKPDKVLFLDVPPEVSQKLVENKEKREYIKDGKTKDLHESDEQHLINAYRAASEVIELFPDWEKIECCEN